jgi:uncharacterized membrane protein
MDPAHSIPARQIGGKADVAIMTRKVGFDEPWNWLALGWQDLWAVPQISLAYGAAFAAAAYILAYQLLHIGALPLLLPLAGGFLLTGPLFAVGLYEISRRRERGERVTFGAIFAAGFAARGQLALFGILLLVIFFVWIRLALLLFMLFFGGAGFPPIDEFVRELLFTAHGLGLLVSGTALGAGLAAGTYAVSAISVPLLLDRQVDVISASAASVRAVIENPAAMMLWAALIAALVAIGVATLFAGLVIVFPLIGHATWHAYRALVSDA